MNAPKVPSPFVRSLLPWSPGTRDWGLDPLQGRSLWAGLTYLWRADCGSMLLACPSPALPHPWHQLRSREPRPAAHRVRDPGRLLGPMRSILEACCDRADFLAARADVSGPWTPNFRPPASVDSLYEPARLHTPDGWTGLEAARGRDVDVPGVRRHLGDAPTAKGRGRGCFRVAQDRAADRGLTSSSFVLGLLSPLARGST